LNRFRRSANGRILRIGHRGAATLEPENTLRSFEAAIRCGVDFVEFDVVELADGTLVVAHSLREVSPEPLAFEDTLAFFAGTSVGLHIDVKCRRRGGDVAAALRRHGLVGRSVASSFRFATLRELRAADPELTIALSYPDDRLRIARRRAVAPLLPAAVAALARSLPYRLPRWLAATAAHVAMLHFAVVSPAAIARCHARDVAVWVWTVTEPDWVERLVELGVDGLIADDPRMLPGSTRAPSTLTT
jgi:glycerophosphoryl diester phosphodiesterase